MRSGCVVGLAVIAAVAIIIILVMVYDMLIALEYFSLPPCTNAPSQIRYTYYAAREMAASVFAITAIGIVLAFMLSFIVLVVEAVVEECR